MSQQEEGTIPPIRDALLRELEACGTDTGAVVRDMATQEPPAGITRVKIPIPQDLHKRLEEVSRKEGVPVGELVNTAVREYLESQRQWPPDSPDQTT